MTLPKRPRMGVTTGVRIPLLGEALACQFSNVSSGEEAISKENIYDQKEKQRRVERRY
jgi:hypothetical protein